MATVQLPPTRGKSLGSKVAVQTTLVATPTLSSLSLSSNHFEVGVQGTIIGYVRGLTAGSTLILINSYSGAVQLNNGIIEVGPSPPGSAGAFNIQLMEVLATASNTPNVTTLEIIQLASLIPVNTALPAIFGTAQNGQTLTATPGSWTNSPISFAYQWKSSGASAGGGGATTPSYMAVASDVGHTLTVTVIATNAFGPGDATSAATDAVIDAIPTINMDGSIQGTPQVGDPITATDAIWNNTVTSVAYQWQSGGVNSPGAGANTLTYTPVISDLGLTLTIAITATNTGGTSIPSISLPSAMVIGGGMLDFSQPMDSGLITLLVA